MYNDAHESKAVTVEMLVMKLLHSTEYQRLLFCRLTLMK